MKFTAGWQASNPIVILHTILQLHSIQFFQQRRAKQNHGQGSANSLADVDREAGDVKRPCRLCIDDGQGQKYGTGIQQRPYKQDTGQKREP